jgi:hypothetical protein
MAATIFKKESGCKLAPPTKTPSTTEDEQKELIFSAFTLPPYKIETL